MRTSVVSPPPRPVRRRWWASLLVCVIAATIPAVVQSNASADAPPPLPPGSYCQGSQVYQSAASPTKAMVIMLENRSQKAVIGSANAPFETALSSQCGNATAAFGATHTSAANYLAMSAGEFPPTAPPGCGSPQACSDATAMSLYSQLDAAGDSWNGFAESMPTPCASASAGSYKIGHNPPIFYPALAAECKGKDLGVPSLGSSAGATDAYGSDVTSGTLPNFSFVAPNLAHDGEGAGGSAAALQAADTALKNTLNFITQGLDYQSGNLDIFVTYDEGNAPDGTTGEDCTNRNLDLPVTNSISAHQDSCHVALLVLNRYATAGNDGTFFDHYSVTKTVEDLFGLGYAAHAGDAQTNSLIGHFGLTAGVRPPPPTTTATSTSSIPTTTASTTPSAPATTTTAVQTTTNPTTTSTPTTDPSTTAARTTTTASTTASTSSTAPTTTAPPAPVQWVGNQTLSDANGNGIQTGWTGVYNSSSRVGLAQPNGDWALKVSTVSSTSAAAGVNNVNPYWMANSTAGTTYTATAQVMPSVIGERVFILLREITAGGSLVGSIPSSTATLTDTGSMTTLPSVSYRSVNSGDQIRYSVIVTNLSGSQVLYVDNPSLTSPSG